MDDTTKHILTLTDDELATLLLMLANYQWLKVQLNANELAILKRVEDLMAGD